MNLCLFVHVVIYLKWRMNEGRRGGEEEDTLEVICFAEGGAFFFSIDLTKTILLRFPRLSLFDHWININKLACGKFEGFI